MFLPDLVFVTSEDDRYLVKGGIGTAIGVMVKTVGAYQPNRRIDWITESPTSEFFVEVEGNTRRHYVPRDTRGERQLLSDFATRVGNYLKNLIDLRRDEARENDLIIEAADWEGLTADYFSGHDEPNILRVSRLHTPLAVCADLNRVGQSDENMLQMARERQQLVASDLLSSPTEYILRRTLDQVLSEESALPPHVVIPNCADVTQTNRVAPDRGSALRELNRLTNLALPDSAFHVFVLGSLEIRKGSEIIQRSIPRLFEAIPNCHLTWIGHCAASGELTANAKVDAITFYAGIPRQWHHRVHLAGFIEHAKLPAVLGAADMYALCYLGDNFPGALLEIAMAGVPMAVLMRGGIPEMVVDAGQALAFALVDMASEAIEDQLVTAALRVHVDPASAKKLAFKLKNHIARTYSAPIVAQRLLTSYEQELVRKIDKSACEKSPAQMTDPRPGSERTNESVVA